MPTRDAIIIGIDKYEASPLMGCVRDASDVEECLGMENYNFNCHKLVDSNATRSNILELIGKTSQEAVDGDMLVIFFAGHGQVISGVSYLVTIDGGPYDPGISIAHLAQIMESSQQHYRHVVVLLDCCHSGAAFNWSSSRPINATDIDREIRTVNESRSILAACRPEQMASESKDPARGVFTNSLVSGLLGDAVNHDGNVSLLSLYEYVAGSIDSTTQTPVFKGDMAGTVILGSGFVARKGPPISTTDRGKVIAKAALLIDEYYNMQLQELLSDRGHRLAVGADTCAKELSGRLDWFRETKIALPDLARDPQWTQFEQRMDDFRHYLSNIEVGQKTPAGVALGLIGHGGYGKVWKVQAEGRLLAMKVFHGDQLQDDMRVQRFRNGYSGMRKLEHPRIVKVHELLDVPYAFTMDYVDGDNLRNSYLDRDDHESIVRIVLDIAETVQHAHLRGVKHRDIKPENIIVRTEGDLKIVPFLTDFDLAYLETNRTITTNLGVGGVINYAAPEQLYKPNTLAAREESVDVFALGQLMFYIITGEDPVAQSSSRNLKTFSHAVNNWIDERAARELIELYTGATRNEPGERIRSMTEFTRHLMRAESYILESSGKSSIPEDRFCEKLAHVYRGIGNYEFGDKFARCTTLSGQLELIIRLKGIQPKNDQDLAMLELEFTTIGGLTIPNFKSGTSARLAINSRLDKALGRYPHAKRRSGTKGAYQVFIEIERVPLSTQGLVDVGDILSTSIGAIEQW